MLFETLRFLVDPEPHGAALNMALDEAVLALAEVPTLRVYRWAAPAVSFGYFEHWADGSAAHPGREPVRRWTGGGVVPHGEDWTYSLCVPQGFAFIRQPAAETYTALHAVLAGVLSQEAGAEAVLTPQAAPKVSAACFENPARSDVLISGRKVAGAAQRRSRFGLLHQGSLQEVVLPASFGAAFATALAGTVEETALRPEEQETGRCLAEMKYGTEAWNHRF